MRFVRFLREHLSVKISLRLIALAIPVLAIGVWRAVEDERAQVKEVLLDRGRTAALAGAAAYGAILEAGLDAGAFTLPELLDPTYRPIAYDVQPEFPRYHTQYDGYTDTHGIQRIEDAILNSLGDLGVYASGVDAHTYVPTPHERYNKKPTGNFILDRAVSRGKRKYDEPELIAAAGYIGKEPTVVIDYLRDKRQPVWDVVAPIYVRGEHFGAFRVGIPQDRVDVEAFDLAIAISRGLAIGVILFGLTIFWATRRAMRPLTDLACAATRLSTADSGTELAQPIHVTSIDEIGRISKALDRMRRSLQVAFHRH